jgi:hypothetical protein
MMTDIRIIRSDLISIVGNNRMPIEKKKELIKRRLIAINTYLESAPNNINNKINNKINNILFFLPSIKYNVQIKKIFKSKLINYLTTIKNFPNIILSQLKKTEESEDNNSETSSDEKTSENNSTSNKISMIYNSITNDKSEESEESEESIDSDSETEQETDEELDSDEDEELDSDEDEEQEDLLDGTVNNLMEDLSDEDKIKLIMKMTKCKLDHVYKMEAEKNRNMERMEELAIKKLKIKNKYKLKKLENKK